MIIKVDSREHSLLFQINKLKNIMPVFNNVTVISETLPLGDIIICDGKIEKLIIERKTAADLISSIKDGRYEEQSYRLNGLEHHNHNIIYLIEGEMSRFNQFKSDNNAFIISDKLKFYSAMFSLNYFKGFSVFRSASLEETALIICNMAYKLEKETSVKKSFYQDKIPLYEVQQIKGMQGIQGMQEIQEMQGMQGMKQIYQSEEIEIHEIQSKTQNPEIHQNTSKEYVNVVKKVKKENITPENIGSIMLCQIPGVSSVTALAIMEKYKTLSNLMKELQTNKDCLKEVASTNAKGQKRKINKSSISNIIKFLNNLEG